MKKRYKGSVTIEASYIVPIFLSIFVLLVTWLFYFHDKNVVAATAHETVAAYCNCEEINKTDVAQYFRKRVRKKLILFSKVRTTVKVDEEQLTLECNARKKQLRMKSKMVMSRTNPEKSLRDKKRITNMIDGGKMD